MTKEENTNLRSKQESLEENIKLIAEKFLEKTKNKDLKIVSHFDTDGIASASIMIQTLKRMNKRFSLQIVKGLEKEFIFSLPKSRPILFLDLASGSLNHIAEAELKDVFILDHHEITQEIPRNVNIVNPQLNSKEEISGAGLTYLFCKQIYPESKGLVKLAVLGMIGDLMEGGINKIKNEISDNDEIKKRKGLLIYPSTRPLNRTLEYSSDPYIPGVTGNNQGVIELLREAGLTPENGRYKSLLELSEEEMSRLVTSIMLRNPRAKNRGIIGDIFLIKIINNLEDARELSAMVNACSRLGETGTALKLCLEIPKAKKRAESIYIQYKQFIITGLKFASETEKIEGNGFVIINAKNEIKDTLVGTIASILSKSSLYAEGTVIITMAYFDDKIKVSSRNVGNKGRNVREILNNVIEKIGGEVGGHKFAAGCIISQEKEKEFIRILKKNFEIELVKI